MRNPRSTTLLVVGIALVVVGLLWTLQGVGVVGGSPMTGSTLWAVVGPVVAIAGIVLAGVSRRRR